MTGLFLKIVNMSISASWLVLAVLVLRLVLHRAPKWVRVLLWGLVAVRLLCPFTLESALSLIPSAETIPMDIQMDTTPALNSGLSSLDRLIPITNTPAPGASVNPLQITVGILANIWCLGMAAMAAYTGFSCWRLRRRVDTAIRVGDDIYESEFVTTPFVFGFLRPRIYLPMAMDAQTRAHVIAHEQAHIRRRDHWWKPLGFLLLTVHWFNPLLWWAYILLCRDIELACDERVIRDLSGVQRADYSQALLDCSIGRRVIAACPLAFGEVGVKQRVRSVLRYKRPGLWLVVLSMLICGVVAVCFLTDPVEYEPVPRDGYYLTIGEQGVAEIKVTAPGTSGGVVNADGSLFRKGERVWLDILEGLPSLAGVTVTALDRDGGILYAVSIPAGETVLQVVGADWSITPQFADGIPSPELVYEFGNADSIRGISRNQLLEAWGDPDGTLSGLYGDIWELFDGRQLIVYYDSMGDVTDIKTEPAPTETPKTAGWTVSAVGSNQQAFKRMMEMGGIPKDFILDTVRALPVVIIRSVGELDEFMARMDGLMSFDRTESDTPSFFDASERYDDSYFETTTLYLIYVTENHWGIRHTVEYVSEAGGTMTIGVQRLEPDELGDAEDGWLLAVGVPRDQLTGITEVTARISSTVYTDRTFPTGTLVRAYAFRESEDPVKPTLALYDDGTFLFNFSVISSYLGVGTYTESDGRLVLHTDDGRFQYTFDRVGDALVFDAAASSEMLWYSGLYDGAVME